MGHGILQVRSLKDYAGVGFGISFIERQQFGSNQDASGKMDIQDIAAQS
jgi:hypothetical protein